MARGNSNVDPDLLAISEEQARLEATIAATLAEPIRLKQQLEECKK